MKKYITLFIVIVAFGKLFAQNGEKIFLKGQEGDTRALIIGISDYEEIKDLEFADRDAIAFYNFLKSPAGGNIDSNNIQLLLNDQAQIGEIVAALEWLKYESKPNDRVLIYFSGHGDVEILTDAQSGYLLTHNAPKACYICGGTLSSYILRDYLTTLSNKGVQVVFIADACRSGKLAGGEEGAIHTNAALSQQWANEIKIMSCQPGEYSLEGKQWGGGRSVFSYYLTEGLQGMADINKDTKVTLSELMVYFTLTVPEETAPLEQNPIVTGNMQTVLAKVDEATLQALLSNKEEDEGVLHALNAKGYVDQLLEKLSPGLTDRYDLFETRLKEGKSLYPKGEAAYDIYLEFKERGDIEDKLLALMERNLAAGLQNEAQHVINEWINGIFLKTDQDITAFEYAAEKLGLVIDLIGEEHPMYNTLYARLLFLQGMIDLVYSKDDATMLAVEQKALKSIQLEPSAAYAYHLMGMAYEELGKADSAAQMMNKAVELAPTWSYPLISLGNSYYDKKQYDKALEQYERAKELDDEYASAYIGIGNIYDIRGDRDKTIMNYKKAIELDSSYATAYSNLGHTYYDMEDYEKAFTAYAQAYQLDPYEAENSINLANVYYMYEDYSHAKEYYKYAIGLDPEDGDGYSGLANIYYNASAYDSAIIFYKTAIEKAPDEAYSYGGLGNVYYVKNDYEEAMKYYQKAIELDSTNIKNHYWLGNVYYSLDQYDLAIKNYQKTLKKDPTYVDAYDGLGNVYYVMQKYDQAVDYYQKAIALNPQDSHAYNWSSYSYENAGDSVLAKFNRACYLALSEGEDEALLKLEEALEAGYNDRKALENTKALDGIRENSQFKKLIKKYF